MLGGLCVSDDINVTQLQTLELGLDLERSMFVVEIKIFNGCRDFFFSMRPNRIGLAYKYILV